ncbi:MAG: OmpH family outer membrane protein [Alphaproteobacteria bacterium]|nr:OmpH family outer membrane protein [Alphaproteobacteria bacterium]
MNNRNRLSALGSALFAVVFGVAMMTTIAVAQTASDTTTDQGTATDAGASMEVRRIAVVSLDGVLRAAAANTKIKELLDGQREKFQEEFRQVELDLQQTERDLLAKRDVIAKDDYDKMVTAFQKRVANVQKDIQYKRQAIDNAYQKALNDVRKLAVDVIKEIAAERQIDLILNRDASVVFLPRLNISDEVLKRLDERTKNARIQIELKKPKAE